MCATRKCEILVEERILRGVTKEKEQKMLLDVTSENRC